MSHFHHIVNMWAIHVLIAPESGTGLNPWSLQRGDPAALLCKSVQIFLVSSRMISSSFMSIRSHWMVWFWMVQTIPSHHNKKWGKPQSNKGFPAHMVKHLKLDFPLICHPSVHQSCVTPDLWVALSDLFSICKGTKQTICNFIWISIHHLCADLMFCSSWDGCLQEQEQITIT